MRTIYTSRWIPKGSLKITRKDAPGALVCFSKNAKGGFTVIGYQGKRNKHDFNYFFGTLAACENHVKGFFDSIAARIERKKAEVVKAAETVANGQRLKVGDILSYSWGYDQTNVEFYQVVSRKERTVKVMRIRATYDQTGDMSGYEHALPGQFVKNAQPITKLEQFDGSGKPYLAMDFGCLRVTNAEEKHYSSSYA